MKITDVLKQELTQWIETYWATYLKGDLETWATFLRDDYRNIGGTKEEIWNSKQEIVDYTSRMMDQMKGHVEFRNRKVDVISYGSQVMLHEFTDVYIKIEGEWILYGPFRMSSLLEKTEKGWMALHQHGSYPDMKAMEGEAFSMDALKAENERLQEAVKTRTIELEIEAALERVRASSMAMMDSSALSVIIYKLYAELTKLDAKLDRAFIMIVNPENQGITWWLAGREGLLAENGFFIQNNQHPSHLMYLEKWENRTKKWQYLFEGKEKKDWDRFGFSETELSKLPDFIKKDMAAVQSVYLSGSSDQFGSLVTGSFEPLPEEQQNILSRFASVFNQTYIRFLDLQKAEAQVREAQIEAALERVRSRSMGMQKSDELKDVIQLVYGQLIHLNVRIHQSGFLIDYKNHNDMHIWMADAIQPVPTMVNFPYVDHPMFHLFNNVKTKGLDFATLLLSKEDKNSLAKESFKYIPGMPEEIKETIYSYPGYAMTGVYLNNIALYAANFEAIPLTESENSIIKRFAQVFEQTYTRFLDLQKAEAQAREAQIETALERVRSASMAMHKSDELKEVVAILFKNLQDLQFGIDKGAALVMTFSPDNYDHIQWISDATQTYAIPFHIPYSKHKITLDQIHARENGIPFYARLYSEKEKNTYFQFLFQNTEYRQVPEEVKKLILESKDFGISIAFEKNSAIAVPSSEGKLVTGDEMDILKRFAKVFEQSYTRFLDLQKAEAQAREAQIEAALERVRSRTMAMHHSNELVETAAILYQQLKDLGLEFWTCGFSIWRTDDPSLTQNWMSSGATGGFLSPLLLTFKEDTGHRNIWEASLRGDTFIEQRFEGAELKKHYNWLMSHPSAVKVFAQLKEAGLTPPPVQYKYAAIFKQGYLLMIAEDPKPITQELAPRFAKVFEQTYTRFLDLQKAEAQAREAQIEAALERIRAASMAMQNSDELSGLVATLFEELTKLDLILYRCIIWIFNPDTLTARIWMANSEDKENAKSYLIKKLEHPYYNSILKAWKEKKANWVYELQGKEKNSIDKLLLNETELSQLPDAVKTGILSSKHTIISGTFNNFGLIEASGPVQQSDEQLEILSRFGKVFDSSYTRFNDLKKAESQAREATIEAALERVRSKTMAMHNSQEVGESVASLFEELVTLGLLGVEDRCGIGIMQPEEMMELWTAEKISGTTVLTIGHLDMSHHILLKNVYQNWLDKKETYQYTLEGDDKLQYYEAIRNQSNYKIKNDYYSAYEKIVHTDFYFKEGCLYVFSLNVISDESTKVFMRFASVFGQTYRRYLDLQNAEALALDTVKRSSVDRVRAEIASMRTRKDLESITPLIWRELTILGIDFIRCGVFIMDEKTEEIQTFLSTPDGNSLSTFRLSYEATGQSRQIVAHWHNKKVFKDHMDEAAFIEYTKDLVRLGAVANNEKYVTENLPKDLYLHFLPFLQGMLYVGNVSQLNDDDLDLVQHLADAFSTAYARYEDFSRLEEAKAIVEAAMNELKDTQNQLVQQEKLASLGQLTAGIAHEIKNPLNFVNNFSEVSLEMLEEIAEERAKSPESRDEGLIDDILSDVRSNLKKVHEHGTRANGIVNSMLQHSRGGTGKKEETDLNVLIKEYVNLSFHGMRAGKNPINVDIALNLDEKIGWVQLIKEDFTRVIINLCNNAFDAMRSKTLADQSRNYLPKLTVTSKKEGKTITITVRDNGPGIPDEIKEKILQPFFTTKKGTEGTGLGLSITNDIIKAHGGELNIESQVGEGLPYGQAGTAFIIQIPAL